MSFRTGETFSAAFPRTKLPFTARITLPVFLLCSNLAGRALRTFPITLIGCECSCWTQIASVVSFLVVVLTFETQLTFVKFGVITVR